MYCFSSGTGVHLDHCIIFCYALGCPLPPPPPIYGWRCGTVFLTSDWSIPGVPKKSGTLDICCFDIKKYSVFWFHQIKHVFWKEQYQDHCNWLSSFDSVVISQNIFIVNFLFHSRDISVRDNDFSDFHTLLPGIPLIRANKTKRELMDCYTRRNKKQKKIVNDCLSRNGCRINTTEPNQMILVSFLSEDNVLSDEFKICYIFEYQSNEIELAAFWDTRYSFISTDNY